VAASEFAREGQGRPLRSAAREERPDRSDLVALYAEVVDAYPLVSIEDGLAENDATGGAS
jgi:enolase